MCSACYSVQPIVYTGYNCDYPYAVNSKYSKGELHQENLKPALALGAVSSQLSHIAPPPPDKYYLGSSKTAQGSAHFHARLLAAQEQKL